MSRRLAILFISLLCIVSVSHAETKSVTAEGKYVMGDMDSKKDARTFALIEAKRMALEQAGTYIESASEVRDFRLTKDQINSLAAGVVSIEVLKEDWKVSGENMALTILIRADVDISGMKASIKSLKEQDKGLESQAAIQEQLLKLQKELEELKAQRLKELKSGDKPGPVEGLKEKHEGIVREMTALDFLQNGQRALARGQWKKAAAEFNQALSQNGNLALAYTGLAFAQMKMGKLNQALASADSAIRLNPGLANGYLVRGIVLREREELHTALESLNRAIQLKPEYVNAYLQRGYVYALLHRPRVAQADFSKACELGSERGCERVKASK